MSFPALPSLAEHHVHTCVTVFGAMGRHFDEEGIQRLREILHRTIAAGWLESPFARVIVTYKTDRDGPTISYSVRSVMLTIADQYQHLVKTRTPPLFGSCPDSKVVHLACSFAAEPRVNVLDVGAGNGRNAIPLAKEGFWVDSVELAPALALQLRQQVAHSDLRNVRVFEGDIFDAALGLPKAHYHLMVLSEVVSHFRRTAQLVELFEAASDLLVPGGLLVFSIFLAQDGYTPDATIRELSQLFWCSIFTRSELLEASSGLPLKLISDEPVAEYEHQHLPPAAWPPTGWFENWSAGRDLFDLQKPPMEMRWIVCRRIGATRSTPDGVVG